MNNTKLSEEKTKIRRVGIEKSHYNNLEILIQAKISKKRENQKTESKRLS